MRSAMLRNHLNTMFQGIWFIIKHRLIPFACMIINNLTFNHVNEYKA